MRCYGGFLGIRMTREGRLFKSWPVFELECVILLQESIFSKFGLTF